MTRQYERLVRSFLKRTAPPQDLILSKWAESHIMLPEGTSARPGRYRNWPYFREILDSIGDPEVEQVTLVKGARLGFTKGLMVAIGATVVTDPCSMILLVPTDDDAKGFAIDEVDPMFEGNPVLSAMMPRRTSDGKNTLTRKTFLGGSSLKILPARAPRQLRRHDAKKLFVDEADAMEVTREGDPVTIAKGRTRAHADRKIVIGSTPTEEGLSAVEREYAVSDQRIFEVPCPHCDERFEIVFKNLQWEKGRPETVACICPNGCIIEERYKLAMVEGGQWRALKPEVTDHRGYRLATFVSLLANASWSVLAREWETALKGGHALMQVFVNQVEGRAWKTSINSLTSEYLEERAEEIGVNMIPEDVLMLTGGADVQNDRIELTVLGWGPPRTGTKTFDPGVPMVLAHWVVEGDTLDDQTWAEFDQLIKGRWMHPHGWPIQLDAVAVDSGGDKGRTAKVMEFCRKRIGRRVYAIKGVAGPRPIWSPAMKVKGAGKLFIVGHDQTKAAVLEMLAREPYLESGERNPNAIRLSEELPENWYDQATGEVRRIKYIGNRAKYTFEPKTRGQRVEALDCLCYGYAVRHSVTVRGVNLAERARRRPAAPGAEPKQAPSRSGGWAAAFNGAD